MCPNINTFVSPTPVPPKSNLLGDHQVFPELAAIQLISQDADVRARTLTDWTPVPLVRDIPAPIEFPCHAFGQILKAASDVIIAGVQASPAIVGQSLLSAASLATQALAVVEVDGRRIPLSIFCLTIAESGERKSAVDKIILSEVRAIERKRFVEFKKEWEFYQRLQRSRSSEVKRGKNANSGSGLPDCGAPLDPVREPIFPAILIEEPTYEAIFKLFASGITVLGLFSDEGSRMACGYAMNAENRVKTMAGLSEMWDAKPLTRARSGEGFDRIEGKRLSMHLMMQPLVAQGLVNDPMALGQGFLARVLVTMPEPISGSRYYSSYNLDESQAVEAYRLRLRTLLTTKLPMSGEEFPLLCPPPIPLSPNAYKLYVDFYNEVESELGPGGQYTDVKPFASKAAEHALRIAGVLALFEQNHLQSISCESMQAGITLSRYYLSESLRIQCGLKIPPQIQSAVRTLNFLHGKGHKEIQLKHIYQFGPKEVRTKDMAEQMVRILEQHRWLRPKSRAIWEVIYG